MATFFGTLGLLASCAFFVFLFLIPSMVTIFFTTKDMRLLVSSGFWLSVCGSWTPSVVGLILFIIIYPLTKAPGEGGIAGLWFLYVGLLMMAIQSVRYVLTIHRGEPSGYLDAVKFAAWPYGIMLVLLAITTLVGMFIMWRDKSGHR
jgi:hypothetical protein